MNAKRKKAESLVYNVMDALDKTKSMSGYYKKLFSTMNDKQFEKYISRKFPFRFQLRVFKIEPTFVEIEKAAKILNIPIMEKVEFPYIYENDKGEAVTSKPAIVGYLHLKKMKQFLTKKNSISTDIANRNNRTGLLLGHDKNGIMSDRELESMTINGLDNSIDEFIRARADSPKAKQSMYNTISTLGYVSKEDIEEDPNDVTSKNLLNVYMLGSHLNTNLINIGNTTPQTIENRTISRRER